MVVNRQLSPNRDYPVGCSPSSFHDAADVPFAEQWLRQIADRRVSNPLTNQLVASESPIRHRKHHATVVITLRVMLTPEASRASRGA